MSEQMEYAEPVSEDVVVEEAVEESAEVIEDLGGEQVEVEANTESELKEEIQEAIEDGATEEEVKSMIKKFTLKVNGKIVEKELDLNDEDSIKRELQKAAAFQKTAQEAATLKKTYEEEIRRLQSDPWKVLEELGLNPEELNEKFLDDRINHLKKTPEQIEREKMETELAQARERIKKIEQEEQSKKEQQVLAKAEAQLEEEIIEALNSHNTLPPTQKTMSRIADALLHAMDFAEEHGYDANSVSVADVIPYVEQEYRNEMRALLDNAPEQMLQEYVGKQNLDRLRKSRVASIKQNPKQTIQPTAKSLKKEETSKEKKSMSDFFRDLQKIN